MLFIKFGIVNKCKKNKKKNEEFKYIYINNTNINHLFLKGIY